MFLSLVAWENKEYFKGALWGSLGILSKVKAGFLFPAFVASSMEEMFVKKQSFKPSYALAALIPVSYTHLILTPLEKSPCSIPRIIPNVL